MIVNSQNLDLAFKGFKSVYTDAYTKAPVTWDKIAMTVPSAVREETYGWLGQFPQMREWLGGERVLKDIEAHSYTIVNRKFESTLNIRREDFDDDRLGIFKPMIAEMGHTARLPPEKPIGCRFGIRGAGTGPASGRRRHDGRGTYRRGPEWRSISCKSSRADGRAEARRG